MISFVWRLVLKKIYHQGTEDIKRNEKGEERKTLSCSSEYFRNISLKHIHSIMIHVPLASSTIISVLFSGRGSETVKKASYMLKVCLELWKNIIFWLSFLCYWNEKKANELDWNEPDTQGAQRTSWGYWKRAKNKSKSCNLNPFLSLFFIFCCFAGAWK